MWIYLCSVHTLLHQWHQNIRFVRTNHLFGSSVFPVKIHKAECHKKANLNLLTSTFWAYLEYSNGKLITENCTVKIHVLEVSA